MDRPFTLSSIGRSVCIEEPRPSPHRTEGAAPSPDERPSSGYYLLTLLTLANFLATIDRFSFTLLLEPIKADLGASDREMSLLAGFAFVAFYVAFGIPLARWVDRGDRRSILALCLATWSAMTAACGLATSVLAMAAARAGLGIGEAGGSPAALSVISDTFPKERRAQAVGIFQSGVALTAILGAPLVGLVAEHHGWRAAFFVLGIPGLVLAALVRWTIAEPLRAASDVAADTAPTGAREALSTIFRNRSFAALFASQLLCGTGYGALAAWTGAFLVRVHDVSLASLGAIVGPIYAPLMLAGSIGGGVLASRLAKRRGDELWSVLLPLIATALAIPAVVGLLLLDSLWPLLLCGGLMNCFLLARNAPVVALALAVVPASMRALAGGTILVATTILGSGFGPLVAGLGSDALAPRLGEAEALRAALLSTSTITLVAGALIGLLPLRRVGGKWTVTHV